MKQNDKIGRILDAAEAIMSKKGVKNTSIAEIAKRAGLTDSLIYNYFKGKEDLLFFIADRRVKEVLITLSEQLQGILDPISKLSKMIWFHLHFNDTHREYARLLLLDCRSNRNFYQHKAYDQIRKYAGIMLDILEEGVKSQIFSANVNMHLVRDIIFGVLDWENLTCLASQEIEESIADFEDILAIILPMIKTDSKKISTERDKSVRILQAAESVFAEKGYEQVTITEIAKLAKVSEGTIYEYYKNKEDLLLSIPRRRFKEHIEALGEIFEIKTPLRKLRRFIRYHFSLYLAERNFLKIFLLHIQLTKRFYGSHVYKDFQKYSQIIDEILDEGKKDESVRASINNRVFKNLLIGSFSHMALRWLILGKELETDKMREIDEVVFLLSKAVAVDTENKI